MALSNFQIPKILTQSDVKEKVGLPMEIVEHMNSIMNGKHSVELTVFDIWGQLWQLEYYTRPTGNRIGPVLTAGWRQYVKEKGVKAGDEFIFSRQQDAGADGVKYMIEVKRQIKTLEGELATVEVVSSSTPMTFM